ncbi:4-vinyl reductase [Candidatus Woesearchaeota archaeon]|nr:4-vinyl reductase [Candidatus Woesearchaeota archaeon]
MAFKAPPKLPNLLEKVIRFKALRWKNGKLALFDVPGILFQLYAFAYKQRLLENQLGIKKAANIYYRVGKFQGKQGVRMTSERFGYAKTFIDKKRLLEFNVQQSNLVGFGEMKWAKIDFNKNIFVMVGKSALAEEYVRFFGLQKNPIDYFLRGCTTAIIEEVVDRKMLCIETKCIAKGNRYCEFVVRPIEDWDKKSLLFKQQLVKDLPNIKELGAKIEPYLLIR